VREPVPHPFAGEEFFQVAFSLFEHRGDDILQDDTMPGSEGNERNAAPHRARADNANDDIGADDYIGVKSERSSWVRHKG
jgi:hypothetical protein